MFRVYLVYSIGSIRPSYAQKPLYSVYSALFGPIRIRSTNMTSQHTVLADLTIQIVNNIRIIAIPHRRTGTWKRAGAVHRTKPGYIAPTIDYFHYLKQKAGPKYPNEASKGTTLREELHVHYLPVVNSAFVQPKYRLGHSRKYLILLYIKKLFCIKVSKKYFFYFWKQKHWLSTLVHPKYLTISVSFYWLQAWRSYWCESDRPCEL